MPPAHGSELMLLLVEHMERLLVMLAVMVVLVLVAGTGREGRGVGERRPTVLRRRPVSQLRVQTRAPMRSFATHPSSPGRGSSDPAAARTELRWHLNVRVRRIGARCLFAATGSKTAGAAACRDISSIDALKKVAA